MFKYPKYRMSLSLWGQYDIWKKDQIFGRWFWIWNVNNESHAYDLIDRLNKTRNCPVVEL